MFIQDSILLMSRQLWRVRCQHETICCDGQPDLCPSGTIRSIRDFIQGRQRHSVIWPNLSRGIGILHQRKVFDHQWSRYPFGFHRTPDSRDVNLDAPATLQSPQREAIRPLPIRQDHSRLPRFQIRVDDRPATLLTELGTKAIKPESRFNRSVPGTFKPYHEQINLIPNPPSRLSIRDSKAYSKPSNRVKRVFSFQNSRLHQYSPSAHSEWGRDATSSISQTIF